MNLFEDIALGVSHVLRDMVLWELLVMGKWLDWVILGVFFQPWWFYDSMIHACPFLSYRGVSPSAHAQKCSLLAYVLCLKWQEMQSPMHSCHQDFLESHTFTVRTVFYKHSFLYSKFIALLCCCPDRNYAQTHQYSCNCFLARKSINKELSDKQDSLFKEKCAYSKN